ncbi:MAG: HAD family hydrolase [Candidatus Zixiibacteriota bacterium]
MTTKAFHPIPRVHAELTPSSGRRFAAIIFDMGSTLLEYDNIPWPTLYRISVDAVYDRLARLGHKPPEREALHERFQNLLDRRRARIHNGHHEYHIGDLLRTLAQANGTRLRRGELSALCDAYYAPITRAVSAYPDARPTLARLHGAGYTIGLLSNTCFRAADHQYDLERFGLWPFFSATFFTSNGRYRKPHPEPFREICRRLSVSPKRCLYIGDRQKEDVQGPQGVGMQAVLVRRPHRKYEPGLTQCAEVTTLLELIDRIPLD